MKRYIALILIIVLMLSGCGGGGGGDGRGGNPGDVRLSVSPNRIDTGDRMEIVVHIDNLTFFDGQFVVVKIRYPSGIRYVQDSTIVKTKNAPDGNFPSQYTSYERDADESTYLVTTLVEENLGGANSLALSVFLEGMQTVQNGKIEVDIDHSDPERDRFDATNPQFTTLDQKNVYVTG